MTIPDFSALVARHRAYFRTGATRPAPWRESQLTALRAMMTDRAEDFDAALGTDQTLGLYVFAEDQHMAEQILCWTTSGDAAVNDCTIQPLVLDLPFGGVGNSGMGKYHGEWGFRSYTNARGVLYQDTQIDPNLRYPPYRRQKALRELVAS